ncbi:MAG: hypothetical protein ACOYIR_03135 [Christensenellales bacterium]|jgi:exopolyphosphatase/guanosine-5'-triphosphate,3'-diphosphate pyrophosphatase
MAKYAVADIGTNSVRLMLADETLRPVEKRLITTRIGEKLAQTGELSEAGMARTLNALCLYAEAAADFGAPLWAFATSAVRDAANREEFLRRALAVGIPIEVVSGEREAELAFLGVGSTERATLIDVGGGSTEVAQGEGGRLHAAFSAPVGCVRALERFGDRDDAQARAALAAWLLAERVWGGGMTMGEALSSLKPAGRVYAVSGTATSIASLFVGATEAYSASAVQDIVVTETDLRAVLNRLGRMTVEQRCAIPVLGERGDLIVHGGVLLLTCMEALEATEITISDADNLEGYLRYRLRKGASGQ